MNRPAPRPAAERQPLVTFALGDDLFAVDVQLVERVLRYVTPTPVPNLPEWATGVIEHQGRVVPVIDLRARFELAEAPVGAERRLVVFGGAHGWTAAAVDAVHTVTAVDPARISPPPAVFRGLAREYLVGVLRDGDRLVMVLDVEHLLSSTERMVLARAVSGEAELAAAAGVEDGAR